MTLIMITHRTETLKIFDKIYEISDGNLEEKKMFDLNQTLGFIISIC